jgi:hypothetical protein
MFFSHFSVRLTGKRKSWVCLATTLEYLLILFTGFLSIYPKLTSAGAVIGPIAKISAI